MAADTDQTRQTQGAPESLNAVPPLLGQEDVDRAVASARRREESDPLTSLPPWIVPAIERTEIDDVALRSRLLGVPAEELQSRSKGPSTELTQEELDLLIASSAIQTRAALTEYAGERPAIEIERITDSVLRAALLGSDPKLENQGASVPDIDMDLFARASQDQSPAPKEGAPEEDRDGGADSGTVGQAEIDALLAAGSTPARQPPGTRPPIGGAIDQAEIDVLLSGPPEASLMVSIDQGDIDALIAAGRLDKVPSDAAAHAAGSSDTLLDQAELDSLFASGTDTGGDMDEPITPSGDDQALLGDPAESAKLLEGRADAAESVESAFLERNAPTTGTATVVHYTAQEAVGGENVDAAAPDGDLGMSQSALDALLARAKGKAKGGSEALPIEELYTPADLDEIVDEPIAPIAAPNRSGAVATSKGPAAFEASAIGEQASATSEPKPRFGTVIVLAGMLRANAARAAASLAAGLAVGGMVYLVMNSNQYRVVRAQPAPQTETASGHRGPGDAQASVQQARRAIDSGLYTQAMAILDEVIANPHAEGDRLEAEYLRLEAWFGSLPAQMADDEAEGFLGEADRVIDGDEDHPRAPEALVWQGQVYERSKNALAARGGYRRIVAEYGDAANRDAAMYELARLDLKLKDPAAADGNANALLNEYPGSSYALRARLLLGDVSLQRGDTEQARRAYLDVAGSVPSGALGAEVYERLARLSLDAGDADGALEILNRRLETATSTEGNDRIFSLLARVHRAKGDLESARTVLNELIDFFPGSALAPQAYVELGELLYELGSADDALRLSAQAVSRFPGNVAVLKGKGEILVRLGNDYEAGVSLYEAHEAGADDPALLLAAGRHFRSAGEYDLAAKTFEELTEHYAGKHEAFEGRIEHAETLGNQDRAAAALEEIEALVVDTADPHDRTEALSALGRIYAEFGLESAVTGVYEQIAAQSTDPVNLAEAASAMIASGSLDEGLAVAARVPLADLPGEAAYLLLVKQGEALARRDPQLAVDKMETAFSAYPTYRTEAGDLLLLETNLRLGRTARARGIVADAETRVASNELDPARLERLANVYGDFLYERGDFRAASDAYGISMRAADRRGGDSADVNREWASLQRANALFEGGQYAEALPLLDEVAAGTSSWKSVAKLRADAARIELRMRGAPAPKAEAQQAG